MNQSRALNSVGLAPRPVIESLAGGLYRDVYVGGVGFGDLGDFFASSRVDCCERLAGLAVHPAIIDQKFCRRQGDLGFRRGG